MSELDFAPTAYLDDTQYVHTSEADRRVPLSIVFILAFIVLTMIVGKILGAGLYIKVLGVLCAFVYAIAAIRGGGVFPKEVLIYWVFAAWSVTGLFVAESAVLVMDKLITMLQFCIMILIVAHYAQSIRATRIMLWALLLGCLIVAVSAYTSGDYLRETKVSEWRVAGIAQGPNYFALVLLSASTIILYFFRSWKSWILKVVVIVMLLIFARLIIASGSRKGFFCFIILIFCWFFFSYLQEIRQRPKALITGMILTLVITAVFLWMVRGSRMGERLAEIYWGGGLGRTVVGRFEAYGIGLKLLIDNPLFGIGLNNFRVVAGLGFMYAHSNYVEVFVSTGFFGGILFFSSYVVLWRRLRRLSRYPLIHPERELVNIGSAYLIVQLATDLFSASYYDKRAWIMLAILIGWSYRLERRLTASVSGGEP